MSTVAFETNGVEPKTPSTRDTEKKEKALAVFLAGRNGTLKRSDVDYTIGQAVMEIKDRVD